MNERTARLRDIVPDLFDRLLGVPASLPVPPAALRRNVGRTSSRDEYLEGGAVAFGELLVAFYSARDAQRSYPRWLDFGCGVARIARYLSRVPDCQHITGVDVDVAAITWSQSAYPAASFKVISGEPPLPLAEQTVDVAFAASVFTHFDEQAQFRWLAEFQRVLAPGGLLIASTHGPHLAPSRPDLLPREVERLSHEGFAYAGGASFNGATAFHSREYLEREWARYFQPRWFRPFGLFQYQDLSVWASAT